VPEEPTLQCAMQSPADAMSCTRYATSTNSFPPVYVKRERRGENPEKLTGIRRFEAGCMLCKRRACDPLPLRTEALRRLPPIQVMIVTEEMGPRVHATSCALLRNPETLDSEQWVLEHPYSHTCFYFCLFFSYLFNKRMLPAD